MVEDNNNLEYSSNIESELFALIKSITNLHDKYKKGIVNDNFFRKTLKNTLDNLLKLNFVLQEKHIPMPVLLKKMNISQEYDSVIEIINRVSSLDIKDDTTKIKNRLFLELPGITSEITSSFITLMDAITLEGLRKKNLIFKLFDELNQNLEKFPGLDNISVKTKSIQNNIQQDFNLLNSNPKFKDQTIEDLYQLFKEFQNKIHLQP